MRADYVSQLKTPAGQSHQCTRKWLVITIEFPPCAADKPNREEIFDEYGNLRKVLLDSSQR